MVCAKVFLNFIFINNCNRTAEILLLWIEFSVYKLHGYRALTLLYTMSFVMVFMLPFFFTCLEIFP